MLCLVNMKDFFIYLFLLIKICVEDSNIVFMVIIDEIIFDYLFFDDIKFGQVVFNLLFNVIKFMLKDKFVRVQVRYKNNRIIFNVVDEGIGISEED